MDKPIIKVLVGQRRVGKSYMLLQLMDEIRNKDVNIIYLDKELDIHSSVTNDKELYDFVVSQLKADKKTIYLLMRFKKLHHLNAV